MYYQYMALSSFTVHKRKISENSLKSTSFVSKPDHNFLVMARVSIDDGE